jgi:hypothetical protein
MEENVLDANLPRSLAFGRWGSLLVLPCTEDESELHLYKVVSDKRSPKVVEMPVSDDQAKDQAKGAPLSSTD